MYKGRKELHTLGCHCKNSMSPVKPLVQVTTESGERQIFQEGEAGKQNARGHLFYIFFKTSVMLQERGGQWGPKME